jgi:putative ABC transport system permease protein
VIVLTTIRNAVLQLGTNKLRTALTMLGIVIGVGAVIALMAAGQGARKDVTESVQGLGSNLLFIRAEAPESKSGAATAFSDITSLNLEDAAAMREVAGVEAVSVKATLPGQVIGGDQNVSTQIVGTDEFQQTVRSKELAAGVFLTADDLERKAMVAVLGWQVAQTLFGSADAAIGENIRINVGPINVNVTVVGVMAELGSSEGNNEDDQVYLPVTTVQARIPFLRDPKGGQNVQEITVKVASSKQLDSVQQAIFSLMFGRHAGVEDFSVKTQNDLLSAANQVTQTLTILLGAIAGISLVVGGIGIMNIMLVSVAERTREIGILKAIGAKRRDIMLQFVVESLMVTIAGGLMGIGVGVLAAQIVDGQSFNDSDPVQTVVTPASVLIAFGVSGLIGLFFGVYPAFTASRLDPVIALRSE